MSYQPRAADAQSVADRGDGESVEAGVLTWLVRIVAVIGVAVVVGVAVTSWGAIVHGYPLYGPLLLVTLVVSVAVGLNTLRARSHPRGWRRIIRIVLVVLSLAWVGLMFWLRPFTAVEPALTAMITDQKVRVTETATQVVRSPSSAASTTGVFFQPGAKVEARAYAAVLRPVAEAGNKVVIAKQPVGIALLALPAFDTAKQDHPEITRWVVGGHSLGGVVAAMEADGGDQDLTAPVVGLLLYASYPANDISTSLKAQVLSLSASQDGLATPAKIDAARPDLPATTQCTVIDGAVHAFFADYGPQPGDGTPTVSHDSERAQISADSAKFVSALTR